MRILYLIIITTLLVPTGAMEQVHAQSSTIRLPRAKMDVREALRLLRVATEHMELGENERACAIYDELLKQFQTWWIPLAGRARCGLKRQENIDKISSWVTLLRKFQAPNHVVQRLQSAVSAEKERLRRLEKKQALKPLKTKPEPKVVQKPIAPIEPAIPPNPDRFMKAWEGGQYSTVLEEAKRFENAQGLTSGILRIAAESALLLNNHSAIDHYMPLLLNRTRNLAILARYLSHLKRRNAETKHKIWAEVWKRWNAGED